MASSGPDGIGSPSIVASLPRAFFRSNSWSWRVVRCSKSASDSDGRRGAGAILSGCLGVMGVACCGDGIAAPGSVPTTP